MPSTTTNNTAGRNRPLQSSFILACISCWCLQLYSLLQWCRSIYVLAVQRYAQLTFSSQQHRYADGSTTADTAEYIQREVSVLPKKPHHLVMSTTALAPVRTGGADVAVLTSSRPGHHRLSAAETRMLEQMADSVGWCLAAGIPQLTLYAAPSTNTDSDQQQQQQQPFYPATANICYWPPERVEQLQQLTTASLSRLLGDRRYTLRWSVLDTSTLTAHTYGATATPDSIHQDSGQDSDLAGFSDNTGPDAHHLSNAMLEHTQQPDLMVFLASPSLGKAHIARIIRQLCREQLPEPDVAALDAHLAIPHFTEPQLMMMTSNELQAFAPWHIRLTEFYQLPVYTVNTGIDPFHLDYWLEGLRRYARCQQRFGK